MTKRFNLFSIRIWVLTSSFLILLLVDLSAQSFWFGPYGGPTLGTQQWSGYDKGPALAYHIGAFIESYSEDNPNNSLYLNIGVHQRGSSLRTTYSNIQGVNIFTRNNNFIFTNISLSLGAKRMVKPDLLKGTYYIFAIRGDYNVDTNLDDYQEFPNLYFPVDDFVNKFTGGVTAGVGYDWQFGEFYGLYIQASISPDFFNQYLSPDLDNVINPYNPLGPAIRVPAQTIKNVTFEVTVGIKFLRKVVYY